MWPERRVIRGCEARGDADSAYLTRYVLKEWRRHKLYLHIFHRSDAYELHDHPWPFVSLILWRGYVEESVLPSTVAREKNGMAKPGSVARWRLYGWTRRARVWPGMLLFRKAQHAHRVELVRSRRTGKEKRAVTLVLVGPKMRVWGFFTLDGWVSWRSYFAKMGCD